jgi:hypothetical protein
MSEKNPKKVSIALSEKHARKQLEEAKQLVNRSKYLLEDYLCNKAPLKYKDMAVSLLAEHLTNTNMYINVISNILLSENRVTNKKTGEETIVVSSTDFELVSAYLTITAGCENELETLGISMRAH